MRAGWAAMSLLQRAGVVTLAVFALSLIALGAWYLLSWRHHEAEDEEELREAVRRRVRDDERAGKSQ